MAVASSTKKRCTSSNVSFYITEMSWVSEAKTSLSTYHLSLKTRLRNAYIVLQAWKQAILFDPSNLTRYWVGSDVCNYTGFYGSGVDEGGFAVVRSSKGKFAREITSSSDGELCPDQAKKINEEIITRMKKKGSRGKKDDESSSDEPEASPVDDEEDVESPVTDAAPKSGDSGRAGARTLEGDHKDELISRKEVELNKKK
ncbi:hypothetical protein F3Y22_tig00112530pilonHSYRG00230 [Hibiscus syriacus]|uniref:Uncharacterized protein n=1 Tax=Hibiscus syriacus TaxID=106335 RepID=A0A6A2XEY6_HIBSY|nr:hypothetical protein F3Y22_tig00112530pilonHSYRG00230 [Hibiscus syriacus]